MRKQTPEFLIGESREAFLRRSIDEAGLTIKDFAIKAGIPVTSMGTILKRGVGTTSLDTAVKICDALEIDLETLSRGEYFASTSDMDIAIINISQRLIKARYALRYRAAALAEMLDIPVQRYYRFESAHYAVPTRYIRLLSQIMGISYEYLSGKADLDSALENLSSVNAPEEFENINLGYAISTFRKKCGVTQADLAERTGRAAELIEQWELRIRVPTEHDLSVLAGVFSELGEPVTLASFGEFLTQEEGFILTEKEAYLVSKYREAGEKEQRIVEMTLEVE